MRGGVVRDGVVLVALVLVALVLVACGGDGIDPYCSDVNDPTGRGVALCRNGSETPVCDAEGDTARWERSASGPMRLVGGTRAFCDEEREVVCVDRAAEPYCLPELRD